MAKITTAREFSPLTDQQLIEAWRRSDEGAQLTGRKELVREIQRRIIRIRRIRCPLEDLGESPPQPSPGGLLSPSREG